MIDSYIQSITALLARSPYVFHYQNAEGLVIFRYDNSPHYPTHDNSPHHKHIGLSEIIPAKPPDLETVLMEIEQFISR